MIARRLLGSFVIVLLSAPYAVAITIPPVDLGTTGDVLTDFVLYDQDPGPLGEIVIPFEAPDHVLPGASIDWDLTWSALQLPLFGSQLTTGWIDAMGNEFATTTVGLGGFKVLSTTLELPVGGDPAYGAFFRFHTTTSPLATFTGSPATVSVTLDGTVGGPVVPEPSSVALALLGALGLAGSGWYRRRCR